MIRKLKCWFGYHRYRTIRALLIGGDLIQCVHCGSQLCIHHGRQQVIPYDDDVKRFEGEMRELLDEVKPSPESSASEGEK